MIFTEKQENQLDEIYEAAYNLLRIMARKNNSTEPIEYEWNMREIGELVDEAEAILSMNGYTPWYPYYDDDEEPHDFDQETGKPE